MIRKFLTFFSILVVVVLAVTVFFQWQRHNVEKTRFTVPVAPMAALAKEYAASSVVAPGFVEPATKELRLGFDISGVIDQVLVNEGEMVQKGQPLAILRQTDYQAQLAEAEARMLEAKANLEMYETGARREERDQAAAEQKRAQVRYGQAQRELKRRQTLIKGGAIGHEELERSAQDARILLHELTIARDAFALIEERYRKEEVEMARQRYAAAMAALDQAKAMLDKTVLKAPVNGTVLRIFSDPGVAYSIFAPSPVLSMGDISILNVRAEVDERDVVRVRKDQKAFVAAEAFGNTKYNGRITRLELSMTPKKVRTGDPSEPVDRSVREVLVTLDAPGPFLSGMRVDVYIETEPPVKEVRQKQASQEIAPAGPAVSFSDPRAAPHKTVPVQVNNIKYGNVPWSAYRHAGLPPLLEGMRPVAGTMEEWGQPSWLSECLGRHQEKRLAFML